MKSYDLAERTLTFARNIRIFLKQLPPSLGMLEDARQLIRSSGSIGANYTEASEALSRKDFLLHLRIARKEAKESLFWLNLLDLNGSVDLKQRHDELTEELLQLLRILSKIINTSQNQN